MEVSFVKISPTQNVTILVTSPVPRERQGAVAARLLAWDSVCGEQVGFLEECGAQPRLQMMGGEFCGNATMSLGAYFAWRGCLPDGGCEERQIEVSGADAPVPCRIERIGDAYRGTVQMPLPESVCEVVLESDDGSRRLPLVCLPGIAHVVAPAAISRAEIERRIRGWNAVVRADALGVLRYDEAAQSMEPIVYVPATDSAVWERGCGSGTAALGCWLASRNGGAVAASICQPGGKIAVEAAQHAGRIAALRICGEVRISASGTAYL